MIFLFTDTQIVVETMLEDLNNVLNSGEIPNLFPQDEQVYCPAFLPFTSRRLDLFPSEISPSMIKAS